MIDYEKIDYKKVEQAQKLLEESGAPHMLAYSKGEGHFSSRVNGQYPTIRQFVIEAMYQTVKDVYKQCGYRAAISEAFSMADTAFERLSVKEEESE